MVRIYEALPATDARQCVYPFQYAGLDFGAQDRIQRSLSIIEMHRAAKLEIAVACMRHAVCGAGWRGRKGGRIHLLGSTSRLHRRVLQTSNFFDMFFVRRRLVRVALWRVGSSRRDSDWHAEKELVPATYITFRSTRWLQ